MPTTATLLRQYLQERELTQAEFAQATGVNPGNLSKMLAGEMVISVENWRRFVEYFADDRRAQMELVASQLYDYCPEEFRQFVEIRKRANGTRVEMFQPPTDEFEAAIASLRTMGGYPRVRENVISLESIARAAVRSGQWTR